VTETAPDGLAVVGAALLARARRDAEDEAAEARASADATLARARAQADEIVAAARAQGAADAAAALSGERSRTLREARARVLRAEREAYDELRRRALADVTALLDRAGPEVRARLVREAAARLGPGAEVRPGARGPTAVAGLRRLTLEPERLVDRVIEGLGPELAGLWSP
jgi:vacuolar-type H+-ATPase subunit E/Vma4